MTSFWRNNDVIIAHCVCWEHFTGSLQRFPLCWPLWGEPSVTCGFSSQTTRNARSLGFSYAISNLVKTKLSCRWFETRQRSCEIIVIFTLLWRHNGHDSVSNHQPYDCLLNRLFRRRSKKTSKLRVTGLCAGNSPGPVISPHKWPVTRKMFPFDDVIMITEIVPPKTFDNMLIKTSTTCVRFSGGNLAE